MQKHISNTSNILQEYKSKVNSTYKNYLSGDELKVTLFKIDKEQTVFAESSETVFEKIGENSGIRFKKINDYVLFNCIETTVETAWSFETGYRAEDTIFEAVAMPTIVQPSVGDYVHFTYMDSTLLLEVLPEISENSIEKTYFKKLKLKVVRYSEANLLDQTTSELVFIPSKDILVSKSFKTAITEIKSNVISAFNNLISNEYSNTNRNFVTKSLDENILLRDGLSKLLLSVTEKRSMYNLESLYNLFLLNDMRGVLSINKDYYTTYYPEYILSVSNVYYSMQVKLFRLLKLLEIDSIISNKTLSLSDKVVAINAKKLSFNTTVPNNSLLLFSMDDIPNKDIDIIEDINFSTFLSNLNINETTLVPINNKELFCINLFLETQFNESYGMSLIIALKMAGKLKPEFLSDDLLLLLISISSDLNDNSIVIYNPEQLLALLSLVTFMNTVEVFQVRYYNSKFLIGGLY